MKTFLLALLIIGPMGTSMAQPPDYEIELSLPGESASLKIRTYWTEEIIVEGYDGETIQVTFGGSGNGKLSREDFLFDVYEENNNVSIFKRQSGDDKNLKIQLRVPRNCSLDVNGHFAERISINNINGDLRIFTQRGDILIGNINGNIEATAFEGGIRIDNISGATILSNTKGNIDVHFTKVSQSEPSAITNIYGETKITIPQESKVTFSLNNLKGEINSNLDLKIAFRTQRASLERKGVLRELNGGGVWMSVDNLKGDITINKN